MTDAERILEEADTIMLVDWAAREVPDALAKSQEARQIVEAADLGYVDDRYIVDVVGGLTPSRRRSST